MKRSVVLWCVAVVVTVGSAVWQRLTGPTHPVRVRATVGEVAVAGRLPRSGTVGEAVEIALSAGPELRGSDEWRRWPTDETWRTIPMQREDDRLVAELPGQSVKAAKVEYRLRIADAQGRQIVSHTRLRFKGAVPTPVLVVHVLAMFLGMLFSLRAGLEALVRGHGLRWQTIVTLVCLGGGGFLLGPIVQNYAFDAYWTGWPVGEDLTDNKLAVAVAFWLVAFWQQRRGRRSWSLVAAAATFVIFAIPHSLHGSTHDWETGQQIQAALAVLRSLA